MSFPVIHERHGEDAMESLNALEMAHLLSRRDKEEIKVRHFPLILKEEAKSWHRSLEVEIQQDWKRLREDFITKFGAGDTLKNLWHQLSKC